METNNTSRRNFLKQCGYLSVGFSLMPVLASCGQAEVNGEDKSLEATSVNIDKSRVDSWIQIDGRGNVTILTGKTELGQGIQTALLQIAAEELEVSLERTAIIIADTQRTPNEGYTAGSNSIEGSGSSIRKAAATARKLLLEKASKVLNTSPDALMVEDGKVFIRGNAGQNTTYWEILEGEQMDEEVNNEVMPKSPAQHQYVGKPVQRIDFPGILTGRQVFVQDLRLPDMVHARVVRPPTYQAKLASLEEAAILEMPGVLKLINSGSFLGVIAEREEQAIKAAEKISQISQWETPGLTGSEDLKASMKQWSDRSQTVVNEGNIPNAGHGTSHEAEYFKPYIMHGAIGPSCAVARKDENQLSVWTHSQGVYPLRATLASMLNIPESHIHVTAVPGAGCYGHNGADDVAGDAAVMALEYPGKPVRVQWMRAQEHQWEPYGSAMIMNLRGTVNEKGKISGWESELWSDTHSTRPGGNAAALLAARYMEEGHQLQSSGYLGGAYRNADPYYQINAKNIVAHFYEGPLRVSALRSLGAFANIFAIESFMDELAHQAALDPVSFRLNHLTDPRARAVVEQAAKNANWKNRSNRKGNGKGIAFSKYKNSASYLAVVAEVECDTGRGAVKILNMWAAIDSGQAINPDGIKNQTEGGLIQSASWTLKEQVNFDENGVQSHDWQRYPIIRFTEVPRVYVEVIDRPEEKSLGAGEAAQGPAAAAIANAVFDATGKRMRDLPITEDKLREN